MDRLSKGDYRLRLKNRYLRKFIKRFDKTKDREKISNLSREFWEELISTGILRGPEFDMLAYSECGRHFTELHFSEHFQCYELLMADIVEFTVDELHLFLLLMILLLLLSQHFLVDSLNFMELEGIIVVVSSQTKDRTGYQ